MLKKHKSKIFKSLKLSNKLKNKGQLKSWPLASKEVRLKMYNPNIPLIFIFTNINVEEVRKIPNNRGGQSRFLPVFVHL